MTRSFESKPAVRSRVPLWVGLFGPSGSGKSYSALRLATGIQSVVGGDVHAIDTEARRLLHYADRFKFKHVEFRAPFGPGDYLDAVNHCVKAGARVVIADSMTHEWEGDGGVLSMHAAELERRSKGDEGRAEKLKMACWIKPKHEHRRLIDGLLQMDCNFIFCFRAREKIKPVKGGNPVELGYQPIAPDDICFEMMLNCLLLPGANGVPAWHPEFQGERAMVKLPIQFRELFSKDPPPQLTEDLGEQLARWAAGDGSATRNPSRVEHGNVALITGLIDEYAKCQDGAGFDDLEAKRAAVWPSATKGEKERLKAAKDDCFARLSKEVPA